MSELEQLISAIAKIADDPQAWLRAVGNVQEVREKLVEIRKAQKEVDEARDAAAKDLETARYERDQAERTTRVAQAQATANGERERELRGAETELARRRQAFDAEAANWKVNVDSREADLTAREAIVAKKLNDANKLMAAYDEAKHQAALKLAS